ncbi:MAG: sulfatase [Deltaproteobacteria bacterium]|nr:sulfatase [Deltaproteobacteria bacterium]
MPEKIFSLALSSGKIILPVICLSAAVTGIHSLTYLNRGPIHQPAPTNNVTANRPNIIVIVFDALAAKHTSLHGHIRNTTPNLDKFAQESFVFTNMYASCNWTVPSVVSILTSKRPNTHKLQNIYFSRFQEKQSQENLPFLLKGLGFYNIGVIGNPNAIPWKLNIEGFDETYSYLPSSRLLTDIVEILTTAGIRSGPWLIQIFTETLPLRNVVNVIQEVRIRRGEYLMENHDNLYFASNALRKASIFLRNKKKPFFLWIHLFPPHHPYFGTMDYFLKAISSIINVKTYRYAPDSQPQIDILSSWYDKHLRHADNDLGNFLNFLEEYRLLEDSLLIITSDHGEMFERGFWMHGGPYLYQTLVHVPLVIHLPGQEHGKNIDSNISHVDLAPTILKLLGKEPPGWMEGVSFAKAFSDAQLQFKTKFSMALSYQNAPPDFKTKSVAAIQGDYKLIKYLDFEDYELYDLKDDPHEKINLVKQEPEIFQQLKKEIDVLLNNN